jgi:hypothetical protein
MSKVTMLFCCVGVVALFSFASLVSAGTVSISLTNPSFESPVQPVDDETFGASGWTSVGGDTAYGYNPKSYLFAGTDDTTYGVPANALGTLPDGGQIGNLTAGVRNSTTYDRRLIQTTGYAVADSDVFTLSFYVGKGLDSAGDWAWQGVTAQLLDGTGAVIGSQDYTTAPTGGTFALQTLTATATSANSGLVGIQFIGHSPSGASTLYQEYIDNVSLSVVTSTPEPSTLVLLASGLFGLLCYAWKKRK